MGMLFTILFRLLVLAGTKSTIRKRDLERLHRIVGGEPVNPGDIPWQVSLQRSIGSTSIYYHFCGGTLINDSWVITAAHCVFGAETSKLITVLGTWNLQESNSVFRILQVFTNDFDPSTFHNDIALLKIDTENPIMISKREGEQGIPIPIENRNEVINKTCVISGWGKDSFHGKSTSILRATKISLLTDEECLKAMTTLKSSFTYSNICAGGLGVDTCQGDSGGPLVCCDDSLPLNVSSCYLTGVTSWGIGCATQGVPGIYTEVAYYADWIMNTMKRTH